MVLHNYNIVIEIDVVASNETEVYEKLEKVYKELLKANVQYDTKEPKVTEEYL